MALVKPFHVVRACLIRDILFLVVTLVFLTAVMVDGFLRLWHCIAIFGFYVFYVAFVMCWHWWLSRTASVEDEVEERGIQNEANATSEETPLLPRNQAPRALERFGDFRPRCQPGFWEHWAEGPQHKVDYHAISPSIASTLRFRHHESLRRQYEAGKVSTSHDYDVHGQIPPERQQPDCMDAHEVTHPRTESQYTLRRMRKVLCPSLQDLKTKTLKHRFISIIIAPTNLLVRLTLPVSDQDKEDEKDADGRFEERQRTPQNWDRWLLITQSFIAPQFILAIVWHQISSDPSRLLLPACICLAGSALVAAAVMLTSNTKKGPNGSGS